MLSEHEKEQIITKLSKIDITSDNTINILLVYDYYKQRGATKTWIPLLGLKASTALNLDIKTTKSALEDMCIARLIEIKSKQCRLASYEA